MRRKRERNEERWGEREKEMKTGGKEVKDKGRKMGRKRERNEERWGE